MKPGEVYRRIGGDFLLDFFDKAIVRQGDLVLVESIRGESPRGSAVIIVLRLGRSVEIQQIAERWELVQP
jgi:hypothetical protein